MSVAPGIDEIRQARERLDGIARVTPVFPSEMLSRIVGRPVLLKAENLQRTGAFKIRGAYNTVAQLSDGERGAGVVTASAGNHGQAVAWAAREAGIPATIVVPESAPMAKVEAARSYGARVQLAGEDYDEALATARSLETETGATFVHAFEDPRVIAGQGTLGLELVDQLPPGQGSVVVPVGGGGLAAGIALALRALRPELRVIGVQAANCAPFAGEEPIGATIADGIAVKQPGKLTKLVLDELLHDVVTVDEEDISQAIVLLLERAKLVVEGAGAAPVAALVAGRVGGEGPSCAVLAGGNVDATTLNSVIRYGLTASGRHLVVALLIPDRPGQLARIVGLIADERANILAITHHREGRRIGVLETEAELTLETRGEEHSQVVIRKLAEAGYTVRRLCGEVGRAASYTRGVIRCAQCGRENPDDARFCNGCASALAAAPAREERKIVTAVFVDLVGSTARAEQLDPEDVRALLRRYHETLRRELERYGGTVEKFIGDAVVAVYGAPTAHEDDPERAVRAALSVREAIARLNERDDTLDLHVRVGVATGEALVALDARSEAGESMVAGDMMNTAARIQSAAPVDGILVGAATHRATERAIVFRAHDPIEAKGKGQPVEVWEAVEALGRVAGIAQATPTPLVGRDHERALLLGAFARTRVDRSTQLVTLVGVPGIGKSRLVAELGQAVLDDEEIISWRYGRCLPYGEGVSFWALGEIVKAQAGIHENDDAATTATKVARAVEDLVPEAERHWVSSSLEPLVGLVPEDVGLRDRRTELYAGWRIFVESLAELRPLVLVIDDLQWADDGLLDFVDGLIDLVEGVPLLVVACARPELLERRPDWGGGKRNALTVSLGPLSAGETSRLVESLLGRDPVDDELREAVVERAAGNPLYAEEFVRMQSAGGNLEGLPDSVLGIVIARVDLLPAAEKELLRDAAVMGGVVWSDGLRAVSEHDGETVDQLLRSLGRKEFLRREGRSAVLGATEHAFVHTLVRDAVYGQLPRPERVDRHVRVARWIESLPDDRREDRAELLAHHYVEAIELARSAGIDVSDLEPKAATALREAGMRAFAIGAFPATVRALRAAAEWLPDGLDARALRALGQALSFTENTGEDELQVAFDRLVAGGAIQEAAVAANDLSLIHWRHGDGVAAASWSARSLELVAGTGPTTEHVDVLAQAARYKMVAGHQEESIAIADEAIALADSVGAPGPRASALITRATAKANAGAYDRVREDLHEALALARVHDPTAIARVHINLGSILLDLGDLAGAIQAAREGVAHCERTGTMEGSGRFVLGNLAEALFFAGEWDEVEAIATAGLDHARRTGGHYHEPLFEWLLAELGLVRPGRTDDAARAARRQIELARQRGDDQVIFPSLAQAAWTLARTGYDAEAGSLLDELLDRRRANPNGLTPGYWTAFVALSLERIGRSGGLVRDEPPGSRFLETALAIDAGRYEDAAATLREIGASQFEAEVRVLAARELRAAGDDAGAEEQLARGRDLLRGLGATARLRELDGSTEPTNRSA